MELEQLKNLGIKEKLKKREIKLSTSPRSIVKFVNSLRKTASGRETRHKALQCNARIQRV